MTIYLQTEIAHIKNNYIIGNGTFGKKAREPFPANLKFITDYPTAVQGTTGDDERNQKHTIKIRGSLTEKKLRVISGCFKVYNRPP